MKYPVIIFYRDSKYDYIDKYLIEFKNDFDCTFFITNNEHDLNGNTTISGNTTNVGNFSVTGGTINFGEVIEASDNSDAILSGLTIGDVYRTGDFLKIVHL